MQKFIPKNHYELEVLIPFITILFTIILVPIFLLDWNLFLFIALLDAPMLYVGFSRWFKKHGLCIDNDMFVFQGFLRKHLDIKDIKGLLILKSEYWTKYSYHYIKNRDKSYKYSIVYLREVDSRFADFNLGDIHFMSNHREDAYFYTVYDEEVIELFKGKIPIIVCK